MDYGVVKANNLVGALIVGVFSLCVAGSTLAQGPPAGAGAPADNNPKAMDRARQVDQSKLRTAEMNAVIDNEGQKRLQAAIVNMKDDFTRIQVLRNDIARGLVARKPLDYKLLSEQTAEINKRASRLSTYMRAHTPEEGKSNDTAELKSEEMTGVLVRLCKLIDSFTENPTLKNAGTIDSKEVAKAKENKAKADADLLAIVKLSDRVRKKSETLAGSN